jgi:hypothetical protein
VASFPALKTGAVGQLGSDRGRKFSSAVYRFVDGKEQRFPLFGAPLKKWVIRMELLDEGELEAVEGFFLSQAGRAGSFEFTDPWDGSVHADCSFDSDVVEAVYRGAGDGAVTVVVKENG